MISSLNEVTLSLSALPLHPQWLTPAAVTYQQLCDWLCTFQERITSTIPLLPNANQSNLDLISNEGAELSRVEHHSHICTVGVACVGTRTGTGGGSHRPAGAGLLESEAQTSRLSRIAHQLASAGVESLVGAPTAS